MGDPTVLMIVRLLHLVCGILWVGGVAMITWYLLPAARAVGPGGAAMMREIAEVRKMPVYLALMSALTILSGIGLYWRDSAGFSSPWMHSGPGMTFGIGGALAILGAIVGMGGSSRLGARLGSMINRLHAEGRAPTDAEAATMSGLQSKLATTAWIALLLVIAAAIAMSVARYVGA
jgi:hypothetical protein